MRGYRLTTGWAGAMLAAVNYGSCSSLRLRQCVGVGVPALVGLLGLVLVAAAPQRPGIAVRLVAAGLGDHGPAKLSQQLVPVTIPELLRQLRGTVILCVPRIPSAALTSRVARRALRT